MIDEYCHLSKNLYNHGNYLIRKKLSESRKWPRYDELDKILKADAEFPDYKAMPSAQCAQQTLRVLDRNWKSFFAAIKDYEKDKSKYLDRPRPPKYLKKDGKFELLLTSQDCRIKDGKVVFPKSFDGFVVNTKCTTRTDFVKLNQVRLIPKQHYFVIEVVYKVKCIDALPDNGRYLGIDIGVNNLATCVVSDGSFGFIINGRPLKSMNQFYNKKKAAVQAELSKTSNRKRSNRLSQLDTKRNFKINDYMHKASRKIVSYCVANGINTIIIGKNKGWKQHVNIGKRNNQTFTQIPFAQFISMIEYKAKERGIAVVTTEESYTSGTSFIDDEKPVKSNYNKSRRIKRGLFRSNDGTCINADLNAAYQIIKKVIPVKWDRGCVLHPVLVAV